MTIPFVGDIIREVGETVREFIPDADKRDEIQVKLAELADKADERETQLLLGQIEVNKEEAKNSNLFVAGWRPFIGWTGGIALGWTWIVAPLVQWVASFWFPQIGVPALDPGEIYPIILALLGISASRTYEKRIGVATSIGGKVLASQTASQTTAPVPETSPTVTPAKTTLTSKIPNWFK